jgi:tRNA modification GTPase
VTRFSETIVAPATSLAPAAVAIVRVSGPEALRIGSRLCGIDSFERFRFAHLLRLRDDVSELDRCLVLPFQGPESFTGEDVVEFHLHGGPGIVRSVIDAVLLQGARMAEPGEFTRRAHLNGKLDLIEAEAIAVRAQAGGALPARFAGLSHRLREQAQNLEIEVTAVRAQIEGALDFDPEELAGGWLRQLESRLSQTLLALQKTVALGRRAAPLFRRPRVLLAGPPNAGKSSLFNALAGEQKAIVSPVAGTTRDLLECELRVPEGRILLMDSAGWRASQDEVEQEGIVRALRAARNADLVLWLEPVGAAPTEPPEGLGSRLHPVRTKGDIGTLVPVGDRVVSALTGDGLEDLLEVISRRVFGDGLPDLEAGVPVSQRQLSSLVQASDALTRAAGALEPGSLELVATDLREAAEALAELTGTAQPDEAMLDKLFEGFCLGK